jgi:hypothetical protein
MAVQGERIPGGFILITGLDGIRYAGRPQSIGIVHDVNAATRPWCSFTAGMSSGSRVR